MKIPTKTMSYEEVIQLPKCRHQSPKRPNFFFRTLVRMAASGDLRDVHFTYTADPAYHKLTSPYLILMNHSSFLDLEIASKIFYPQPYCIVCTSDGFVGKEGLMRSIGCIPTQKFVSDLTLVRDLSSALHTQKTSVLMYPEASYSFDGCATPLPQSLGSLIRMLKVPVVYVQTFGSFIRDPLYNNLQKRKVNVTAHVSVLLSSEETASMTAEEINLRLKDAFSFDSFTWQKEQKIEITEPFRADGLERVLYQCPHCSSSEKVSARGIKWKCGNCSTEYELQTDGSLRCLNAEPKFTHIPDWYRWERANVLREIQNGTYLLDTDVDIGMMVDYKAIYLVGSGHLRHNEHGFVLDGCNGQLHYEQKPQSSYGLYADYFWYELGDIICIGNKDALYYCFPKQQGIVAKTRLATEELYKITHDRIRVKK